MDDVDDVGCVAPRGPLGVLCRFGGATTTKVFFCYNWWCNCFSWYYCCYTHLSQVLRLPRKKKDNEMSKRQKYCACHTKRKSNAIQNRPKSQFHEGTRKHAQKHEKRTHYKCIPHSVWDFRRRPRPANDGTTQAKRTQVQVPDPPAINGNPSLRIREKCNRNERHKCFTTRHANIQCMYMCVYVYMRSTNLKKIYVYLSHLCISIGLCSHSAIQGLASSVNDVIAFASACKQESLEVNVGKFTIH